MSITDVYARATAEAIVAFADEARMEFSRGRNAADAEIYACAFGDDLIERPVGRSSLAVRSPAGRVVAAISLNAEGRAVVDCGGGPKELTGKDEVLGERLAVAVSAILHATRAGAEADVGVLAGLAGGAGAPGIFTEPDGSTWHVLRTRSQRDRDRQELGHRLGMEDEPGHAHEEALAACPAVLAAVHRIGTWQDVANLLPKPEPKPRKAKAPSPAAA